MKGIGATGAINGSRGSVGITPTGVEVGLNVGIGQLGISTDYGGGIVVGIFGQKIVWGREGGKIHYNLGGLEVVAEARNCVVIETRKILGQVVALHTYPDPGCKLPEPPEIPPKTPGSNLPPGALSPVQIDAAMLTSPCKKLCVLLHNHFDSDPENPYVTGVESICLKPRQVRSSATGNLTNQTITSWDSEYVEEIWDDEVKPSLEEWDKAFKNYSIGSNSDYYTIDPDTRAKCFPEKLPPPYAGNQPPMPDSCCESLKADIEDIKEVLACKEILAGKMTFPWRWRMPGGEGEEKIMDYPNLARAIAQMIDHLGIHPPKLSIKDINNAIAGDQSIDNQFPSATQGFEALMAQVWDANADVDTLTNFLYRLSWLCVQQSMNLARLSGDIQVLKDMLGGETEPTETSITTPFNIGAGIVEAPTKGKGFGKKENGGKINRQIDANTEIATESLLPDFLRIRENPIIIEKFSGNKDVMDKLDYLIMQIERLQNR